MEEEDPGHLLSGLREQVLPFTVVVVILAIVACEISWLSPAVTPGTIVSRLPGPLAACIIFSPFPAIPLLGGWYSGNRAGSILAGIVPLPLFFPAVMFFIAYYDLFINGGMFGQVPLADPPSGSPEASFFTKPPVVPVLPDMGAPWRGVRQRHVHRPLFPDCPDSPDDSFWGISDGRPGDPRDHIDHATPRGLPAPQDRNRLPCTSGSIPGISEPGRPDPGGE